MNQQTEIEMLCPRRQESNMGMNFPGPDKWREDNTCSYCGSLNPDTFMERCEAGDVTLGPTDKNYKVYLDNKGGELFKQTYRKCPEGSPRHGPDECDHWVTEERDHTKFYFQHLSEDQRKRFIELINEKKLHMGLPGHFYARPFFCVPVSKKG